MVASKQGSTVTLGEFYRGREITIVHGNDTSALNPGIGGRLVPLPQTQGGCQPLCLATPQNFDFMGNGSIKKLSMGQCPHGTVRGERVKSIISRTDTEMSFGNGLSQT